MHFIYIFIKFVHLKRLFKLKRIIFYFLLGENKHRPRESKTKIFVNSEFENVIKKIKTSNGAVIPKQQIEPNFSLGNRKNPQQLDNTNQLNNSNNNDCNLKNSKSLNQEVIDEKMTLMLTSNEKCTNPKASPIFKVY